MPCQQLWAVFDASFSKVSASFTNQIFDKSFMLLKSDAGLRLSSVFISKHCMKYSVNNVIFFNMILRRNMMHVYDEILTFACFPVQKSKQTWYLLLLFTITAKRKECLNNTWATRMWILTNPICFGPDVTCYKQKLCNMVTWFDSAVASQKESSLLWIPASVSEWSLHFLPLSVWVFFRSYTFLPRSTEILNLGSLETPNYI